MLNLTAKHRWFVFLGNSVGKPLKPVESSSHDLRDVVGHIRGQQVNAMLKDTFPKVNPLFTSIAIFVR